MGSALRRKGEDPQRAGEPLYGIPEVHYSDGNHWVCGNHGVSEWTSTGTTQAGVRLEVHGCDLWEFREDKVVRKDSYCANDSMTGR